MKARENFVDEKQIAVIVLNCGKFQSDERQKPTNLVEGD
jgi:hypothetical protein